MGSELRLDFGGSAWLVKRSKRTPRENMAVRPVNRLGPYFLARVRRSPLGVRQSGPLGHSRRSIRYRPIRRDLISGSILGCVGVPSTAASAVNSVLARRGSFALRGTEPPPNQGVCSQLKTP